MLNHSSIQQLLDQITQSSEYDRLNLFKDFKCWQQMSNTQKVQLAQLFVAQGEEFLKSADRQVFESFEWASKIAPDEPFIFLRQGVALNQANNHSGCLIYACEVFEKAIKLQPTLFEAWRGWGETLQHLGVLHAEARYLQDSHQKFQTAFDQLKDQVDKEKAELFWLWGKTWYFQGKLSGEAHDFYSALEKYRLAMMHGETQAKFWLEYGCAVVELGVLIGRKDLFIEGIAFFENAVREDSLNFDGWFSLGYAHQCLYEIDGDLEHFKAANESYTKASTLHTEDFNLWLKWGQLLVICGKATRDIEQLRASFEKFIKANVCEANHPQVLSRWGEAEMLLGANIEQVDLLRSAEQKIITSLELAPDQVETWSLCGTCLSELGRYFGEERYYFDAIEMFKYAISLNQKDPLLWYGLALAHFSLGELNQECEMIEKAVRCFSRVIEFGGHSFPQFWNDWGVALMKLSEMTSEQSYIEAAIEKFERAFSKVDLEDVEDSIEPEWLYNYGCALDFLGDYTEDAAYYEKAAEVLSKVLRIDPEYYHARYNLALALSHLGETSSDIHALQKANELFELLLEKDNEDEMAWNDWGLSLLHLAQLIEDPLNTELARKCFEEAENKFLHAAALGFTPAFYNLACLYSLNGNASTAMHYIERAELAGSLPPIEDLMHDDWLYFLRQTPTFRHFLSQLVIKDQNENKPSA